jgi:uncharacterized membrane protein YidH (DUF202 family)
VEERDANRRSQLANERTFVAYGPLRREQVDRALVRGEWAPFPAAGGGVILGVAIAAIVFVRT